MWLMEVELQVITLKGFMNFQELEQVMLQMKQLVMQTMIVKGLL